MVTPSSCNFRYQSFLAKFPFQLQIHPPHTLFFFLIFTNAVSKSILNTNLRKENQFEATLSFTVSSQHRWDIHELCISENFTEAFSYFVAIFSCNMSLHSSKKTATAAKSLQSCPTLCDPIDGSPPGSPVPGILQARTLEWVAISFSNAWKWQGKVKSLSRVWLLATPWTTAYQAPRPWDFPGKSTGVGCHCLLKDY